MDERFRDKRLWVGLGALAILFFCVAMCGLSSMATFLMRDGISQPPAVYPQPPAADTDIAPQPPTHGYAPYGAWRPAGSGFLGTLFRLMLFGVMLLVAIGLLKRVFWGRHYCGYHHWGRHARMPHPPHRPKPPSGVDCRCGPHRKWGPWPWAAPGEAGSQEPGTTSSAEETESGETTYTGPQE
jgi:hypothetical protein